MKLGLSDVNLGARFKDYLCVSRICMGSWMILIVFSHYGFVSIVGKTYLFEIRIGQSVRDVN